MTYSLKLLEAATTTGSGDYKIWSGSSSRANLVVSGTFDGASVTFQFLDNGSAVNLYLNSTTILTINGTAAQSYEVVIPYGQQIKATIAGAGAGTSLYATLYQINN